MNDNVPAKKDPNALSVTYAIESGNITITREDVRNYLAPGAKGLTDAEILLFLKLCQYKKLNPFIREAYIVKYSERDPASLITSKDVFLKRAENHKAYDGLSAGVVVGIKNEGKPELVEREGTIVLGDEILVGGWCKVKRKDRSEPHFVTVSLKEYGKKTSEGVYTRFWRDLMATMIRKVAIVHALREAFPGELSGMYTEDEMKFEKATIEETTQTAEQVYEVSTALLDRIFDAGDALGLTQGQVRQRLAKYHGREEDLAKELEDMVTLKQTSAPAPEATEEGQLPLGAE